MLGRLRLLAPRGVGAVRYGSGGAAEFSGKARQAGIQMIVEGTVLGTVMAVWWRYTHNVEKAKYDMYYANLRAMKTDE